MTGQATVHLGAGTGCELQVADPHVARLPRERQRQPLRRAIRSGHLAAVHPVASGELHAVEQDEDVGLGEQAEVPGVREPVGLRDDHALPFGPSPLTQSVPAGARAGQRRW